ncbi:MAG: Na/Pi symporter, partial [Clostridia bacterium]|nr:Na/Pi symporter [Clostridia bacterium]
MKRVINYTVQLKFLVENALFLLGGVSVFLYGLRLMSVNMQKLAGKKMQALLSRSTSSRIKGAAVGAAVTAVIQSSTAANVMLAGFVNAGAISSAQAMAVVMGANVGTTITAQLVSFSGNSLFNVTAAGSLVAFIGFLFSFSKKGGREAFGSALFGLGALFIGLEIMNGSVIALHGNDFFKRLFLAENPFVLVLNGLLITGVVQSSSAVSSVIILLARGGLIGFADGAYMLLGT